MSKVSRSFNAVWLEDARCPCPRRHFQGCAREVYGYLEKLAQNHGGFVFASVPDITRHTKKWNRGQEPFSQRECERILRIFRKLGILESSCVRTIHGRKYRGWQFREHDSWAQSGGGMCEFKQWMKLEDSDSQRFTQQNVGIDDGADVGADDGEFTQNVGANVGAATDVLRAKSVGNRELQAATIP